MGKSLNQVTEASLVPMRARTLLHGDELELILETSCVLETSMAFLCISIDDPAEKIVVTKDFLSGKGFFLSFLKKIYLY